MSSADQVLNLLNYQRLDSEAGQNTSQESTTERPKPYHIQPLRGYMASQARGSLR